MAPFRRNLAVQEMCQKAHDGPPQCIQNELYSSRGLLPTFSHLKTSISSFFSPLVENFDGSHLKANGKTGLN